MKEPYNLIEVDINQIDAARKTADDSTVNNELVNRLKESMEREGLLAPIGVRDHPNGTGIADEHYRLVFGRNRLTAAKRLGWTTIPARDFGDISDDQAAMITIVENLFRKAMSTPDRNNQMASLKRLIDLYNTQYPDAAGRGTHKTPEGQAAIAARGGRPRLSLASTVAASSGTSQRAAEVQLKIARAFTQEQHECLNAVDTSDEVKLKIIAASTDMAFRAAVCKLWVQGGVSLGDCFAIATEDLKQAAKEQPPQPPPGRGRPHTETSATTGEPYTDQEWLNAWGIPEVRRNLRDATTFDQAAIAFRRTREARKNFRRAVEIAIPDIKTGNRKYDPFTQLLKRVLYCEHPQAWQVCNHCHGKGISEGNNSINCDYCWGTGFIIKMERTQ